MIDEGQYMVKLRAPVSVLCVQSFLSLPDGLLLQVGVQVHLLSFLFLWSLRHCGGREHMTAQFLSKSHFIKPNREVEQEKEIDFLHFINCGARDFLGTIPGDLGLVSTGLSPSLEVRMQ